MKNGWCRYKLGDLLIRSSDTAQPAADVEYKEITIRLWGKGVIERGRISGSAVNGRRFIARKDQFIASRIDARNGAMGIVPEFLDGALVTNDFPLFEVNQALLHPHYMGWLCRTPTFVDLCARASEGTTNRVRLKESEFLQLEIQIPDTKEQKKIVTRIDAVRSQLQAADKLRSSIDRDVSSLLAVRFKETLTHAAWMPMREVAPIVRREVEIKPESNYSELGVRSFFKGAFIRRTVTGADFTWQKLYQVKTDDLIFSNIMAWEKGIALANSFHDQCVGNHRMLTCKANPELTLAGYLHYYFTTDDGFAKVYTASQGTAARNRTLTTDSLMGLTVPAPSLAVQRQFVELKNSLEKLVAKRAEQNHITDAILPSTLNHLLG